MIGSSLQPNEIQKLKKENTTQTQIAPFLIIFPLFSFLFFIGWAAALGQACPQEYQGRDVRSKTR